ncbi:hypothetical protein KJ765_04790 [Candidatus Micrarchaeota archaeon]|nr:hypothetical protein [Candidatus Micrarchaeota archaeon]
MRGQVAVEMFLTMSIGLLILFWFTNYMSTFEESVRMTGVAQQQKLLTKDLARSVNEVCVRDVNLSIKTPCLMFKDHNILYKVSNALAPDDQNLTTYTSFSDTTMHQKTSCMLDTSALPESIQCAELAYLCVSKNPVNRKVYVSEGRCT